MLAASTANQSAHDVFGMTEEIGALLDPSKLDHGGEREALPLEALQRAGELTTWLLEKHVGGDAEIRVQRTRHLTRKLALARQNFGHLGPAAKEWDQIPRREPTLLHTKAKGFNGTRIPDRHMPRLIELHEVGEHIQLIAVRGTEFRVHRRIDAGEGSLVVCLGADRSNGAHVTPR